MPEKKKKRASRRVPSQTLAPPPLPRDDSAYAKAKHAQYILKDLELAKNYFQQAIQEDVRAESAVKDLASILHQQRRTNEALECLTQHAECFSDRRKLQNLYRSFEKQLAPSGNYLNTILKISPVPETHSTDEIADMFTDPGRIQKITMYSEFALVSFPTHSAARKTLESFTQWKSRVVEWVSSSGVIQGLAACGYTIQKRYLHKPTLTSLLEGSDDEEAVFLLGKSLYEVII